MSTSISYDETNRLRQQIGQCVREDRFEDAESLLRSLIERAPDDVPACLQLADVLMRRGQFRGASRPLLQAVRHLPRNAPLLLELAGHLVLHGEIVAARSCLDFLAQAPDPPPEILVAQAHHRFSIGEIVQAKAFLERAFEAGADDPDDYHMHAMLLQFTGDIDGAVAVLEKCLQRWPHYGDAAVVLVNLRKQKPESNRLAYVEEQLRRLPPDEDDPARKFVRADFEYARFKVLDDLGRHDEAWESLSRCNALMHELNPYEREREKAVVDALIDMPVTSGSRAPGGTGFEGPVPIFIVGMPRSGTTLLDRMLSSHSRVTAAGELIEFWRQLHWVANERPENTQSLGRIIGRSSDIDFHEVGERYLAQTQWRADGRGYYIDKLPANIQMVEFIRRALPHAPILHMVRDSMDVCFSNYKALFGNIAPYSYEMGALAHYYRQYRRLWQHWGAAAPGAMLDVSYRALVQDPSTVMGEVLRHCGLDIEEACLHPESNPQPVATPSSAQVRQPIHTRGLGQWRKYEMQLAPLRRAIEGD